MRKGGWKDLGATLMKQTAEVLIFGKFAGNSMPCFSKRTKEVQ